ncbi:hypothetical protein M5E06_17910 [Azospirillum sp. A1-3]|uniref:hypothetical protein n=1 Tax=Azospirillum sp. A1-3 TaxID=185874 RepID=UPI00207741A1|nr:hypothetical protein [Azospirillum sp. A1-3]MCM8736012.1 hypothetical protein [Azospirillum sp. A1-3]
MSMFRNPSNGYRQSVGPQTVAWMLFLGPIYLLAKGAWSYAAITLMVMALIAFVPGVPLLAICGIWIAFAMSSPLMMADHYKRSGWIEE